MINEKYFEDINNKLINILDNSDLNVKEIKTRKEKLNKKLMNMIEKEKIDNHYVSLAHEIKSYQFLKKYGCLQIAIDSNSEVEPDFKLNNYKIECVCCSSGETDKNGLENYRLSENRKSMIVDYNKLLEILLPRITQELCIKSKKLKKYIDNRNSEKRRSMYYFYIIRRYCTRFF